MAVGQSTALPHRREPIDIAEWTSRAAEELANFTLEAATDVSTRRTPVQLDIPIDVNEIRPRSSEAQAGLSKILRDDDDEAHGEVNKAYGRRTPMRRDSLKRREALLKGKEGSRRRQRWENDRLLSNPHAQPPLPSDWEVHPTHPVHAVPYYLAPLWDAGMKAKYTERRARTRTGAGAAQGSAQAITPVPKDLREKLKRARGAKSLLIDLELEVRRFVQRWNECEGKRASEDLPDPDSEDDEVVFIGRNGEMSDMLPSSRVSSGSVEREKLVFDSLEDDRGANFGRWLVHSIGQYYGLNTWSITVGDPARREAYVGIKSNRLKAGRSEAPATLPRPLYGLV